ncbi:MAG: B12-binding domain-containing radical SAM protein [Candidatus Hodarchaeales archaeon]|jgi:anaerobic magnesium-protoporphyrin IX monomethyl ester cyclase
MNIALVMSKSTFLELPMVMQPLGLFYIAARLESLGHKTDFFDLNVMEFPEDNYDQIWVSATSPQMAEVRKIDEILVDYTTKTVLGGPAYWSNPEISQELWFDVFVAGEADNPEAMKRILKTVVGTIDVGISPSLDWVLPPVRRWSHLYDSWLSDRRCTTMFTTRGCPMGCAFCESGRHGVIWGNRTRYEPMWVVEHQIDEAKGLGYGALAYYDDILPLHKNRTLAIMELHKKYDMIWRCFLRSDIIHRHGGYDYLKQLRDGGLVEVFVGVESASNVIKENIHKGTTIEQDTNIVRWCKQLGIRCKASFILGLPGESSETIEETEEWIFRNRPDRVQIGRLIPFSGTPLTKNIENYDLNIEHNMDEDWFYMGKNNFNHSFVATSSLSVDEIDYQWHRINERLEKEGISK